MSYEVLDRVAHPEDLRSLGLEDLDILGRELRHLITHTVSTNGGHLASNLGVVDLTIALHLAFASPVDKIVWDVGHQCYAHKILTGRRDLFRTLRTFGGLSGFPRRSESEHDIVDTGHASTSISAALGILTAQEMRGVPGRVVVVIGDGALGGGMAFEALNHAGHLGKKLVIVVNDNTMSIARNVGALSSYLTQLSATRLYQGFRRRFDQSVGGIPVVGSPLLRFIYRLKKVLKALIFRDTFFSDLGFEYVGPIDGHNIELMGRVFGSLESFEKPVVVHVVTKKGKGYDPAEGDPTRYHGVSPFSLSDGKIEVRDRLTFTESFSCALLRMAEADPLVVAITAAMPDGTGLRAMQSRFPKRVFDVGISEQHAVTFAAGLATAGMKPVVAIYSTFLQRSVDQVIHDVAVPGLPVVFAVDRCGIVGEDGETHQGLFDIALFRSVPGLEILAPASDGEMDCMLRYALGCGRPVIIRYPRADTALGIPALDAAIEPGRGVFAAPGHPSAAGDQSSTLLICVGGLLQQALAARSLLSIPLDVYSLRFVKPLDFDYLREVTAGYQDVFFLEDGVVNGGVGEYVVSKLGPSVPGTCFHHHGVSNWFVPHGRRSQLLAVCGLDAPGIALRIESVMGAPRNA